MKIFAVHSRSKPVWYCLFIACLVPALVLPSITVAQTKGIKQVVKPPVAFAYIDVATSGSDMPGGNMMGAAANGGRSGGFFGALAACQT